MEFRINERSFKPVKPSACSRPSRLVQAVKRKRKLKLQPEYRENAMVQLPAAASAPPGSRHALCFYFPSSENASNTFPGAPPKKAWTKPLGGIR
jgi:hypothetical protein